MKIDTALFVTDLDKMPALTRAAEEMNFDGIWTFETAHDPFLSLALAAEHSRRLSLGTSIAVAFSRSPAVLAYVGWDRARFSKGRFIMGLGSQVKAHNERRFGVKWEKPVKKMREVILAIRAIWDCGKTPRRCWCPGSSAGCVQQPAPMTGMGHAQFQMSRSHQNSSPLQPLSEPASYLDR